MRAAIVFAIVAAAATADAHGLRSVYVELTELDTGRARVTMRSNVPVSGVDLAVDAPCTLETTETGRWLACPHGLAGAALTVHGMGTIISDAVIYVTLRDGTQLSACATPRDPTWLIPGAAADGTLATARRYVMLGLLHIATGADHLLFLLALVLCLRRLRAVLLAETAFTLSHTLSFSASALGWIHVSAAAAEACIAVSLVLVALDIRYSAPSFGGAARSGKAGPFAGEPLRESPYKIAGLAFAFGLVHGLGFAGGLVEIGLPAAAVPGALAGFAAGVELGQVMFLALVVGALALVARRRMLDAAVVRLGAYAVGGIGCFWLFERLAVLR